MARKFMFNGMELVDPNPSMTPEQVKGLHAIDHPELTTATVTGPEKSGEDQVYKFVRAVGAKG